MLTTVQRATFERDGFVVVGPLIDARQVGSLQRAFDRRMELWAAEVGASTGEYLEVVSQWTNVWEHDPVFREQMHHPRVAATACALIGCERVRVFHDHLIVKPPRGGATIPWHRDLPNWPLRAPRAVSCWLALDDVTADSGAMRFMPGGHRDPMTTSIDFLNQAKDWGAREADAVEVEIPAGWAVFHHCLSWHTSPANRTDRWRRAYITICMDADSRYAPERAKWHPMAKRVTVAPGEVFNGDVFPILGELEGAR